MIVIVSGKGRFLRDCETWGRWMMGFECYAVNLFLKGEKTGERVLLLPSNLYSKHLDLTQRADKAAQKTMPSQKCNLYSGRFLILGRLT